MARRPDDVAGIVVPLRSFTGAKARLAEVLDGPARAALARSMADRVIDATGSHAVVIVSSAPEVQAWAAGRSLDVIGDPGSLDAAAGAGQAWAEARGLTRYAIVHADLPRVSTLEAVLADGGASVAVVVPDHRDDGTPILSLPTSAPFVFSYGPGSAARHIAAARALDLEVRIVRDPDLAFDVDIPADLDALAVHEREAVR